MVDSQMTLEGDLRNVNLPRVLQSIAAQKSTGILTIQGEEDIVAVSCLDGQVMAADALNQTVEDGLGEVLVSQKLITAESFEAAANEHQSGSAGSLGELLVERQLINRKQLLDALRIQTFRMMLQVLTWRSGEFKFYGGDEVSYEEGVAPITVDELLIRALEKLGERSGLRGEVPKLEAVYRQVPPRGTVQVLSRDGDGTGGGIWISEEQEAFLKRIDGQHSALALAKATGFGRFKALFTLHQLVANDLIEVATGAPARAAEVPAVPPAVTPAPAAAPAPARPPSGPIPAPARRPPSGPIAPRPAAPRPARPAPVPAARPAPVPAARPRPAPAEAAKPTIPPHPTGLVPWIGPSLAAFLFVVLVLVLVQRPGSYLLPFPWQENQRSTIERQLRQALYLKIDRAGRTYFLMEAHYPDTLEELTTYGLLSRVDLKDPGANSLRYSADDISYGIEIIRKGLVQEGLGMKEAIAGDFLLDPQVIAAAPMTEDPLFLLD